MFLKIPVVFKIQKSTRKRKNSGNQNCNITSKENLLKKKIIFQKIMGLSFTTGNAKIKVKSIYHKQEDQMI